MEETEAKNLKSQAGVMDLSMPKPTEDYDVHPPYNFSWLVDNKIAGMGWPHSVENLNYLVKVGINHLVTLSQEMIPPILELPASRKLEWTEIPVEDFEAPTLRQILQFIGICQRAELKGEVVGVHCRQGRGRTAVMLASYLVYTQNMAPEHAILTVKAQRPEFHRRTRNVELHAMWLVTFRTGSFETYEQEDAVCRYHECTRQLAEKTNEKEEEHSNSNRRRNNFKLKMK